MVDTCTIVRRTSVGTDPETGHIIYSDNQLYSGICRVQRRTFFNRPHDAAQDFVLMLAVEVWTPMTVEGVTAEDRITITSSRWDNDLVNRFFSVKGMSHKSHGDSRRFECIEVNS
jgi:hypothetical protein